MGPLIMAEWLNQIPNRRLELIDGKFLTGLSLEGSRQLLKLLLESWGGNAALSLTDSLEAWIVAVDEVYPDIYPGKEYRKIDPETVAGRPAAARPDYRITGDRRSLSLASELGTRLYGCNGFRTYFGDFVGKLGDDALTPNLMLAAPGSGREKSWYFDGPPEIAVEFFHGDWTMSNHLEIYRQNHVPEIWLFDVDGGVVEKIARKKNETETVERFHHGVLSSGALPGLRLEIRPGWHNSAREDEPFVPITESGTETGQPESDDNGIGWDSIVFEPRIGLFPARISFAEFISWTGEAKLETFDGRLVAGGSDTTTRNILGQLLMTFGLIDACALMPPDFWVDAINHRILQVENQIFIREKMWSDARQATNLLKANFGLRRIGVAGDLVQDKILGQWSKITLILPEMPDFYEVYRAFTERMEDEIEFYHEGDAIPLEVRNTFSRMIFL